MKHFIKGFSAGAIVASLAGLIGLGGAEFRLPILKSLFGLATLKAVILNKATSLVVVFFALIFRSYEVPLEDVWAHKTILLNLLSGSLIGAWIAAGYAMKIDERLLDKIIFIILLLLAGVLVFEHWFLVHTEGAFFDSLLVEIFTGIIAGFIIGSVASLLGVAGGELLIPTIVILYGVDIKLAGSLSLAISLPTIIIGFTRYVKSQSFVVLQEQKKLFFSLALGSILGAGIGAALLGFISSNIVVAILVCILIISAYKSFRH